MINRENWKALKNYLTYMDEVNMIDQKTLDNMRSRLRHVLEWADEKPLAVAPTIRPTFQRYINGRGLARQTVIQICSAARAWFTWLRMACQRKYPKLTELYISTIRIPRQSMIEIRDHRFYTPDELRAIADIPATTQAQQRDKAAICLLFLSGMRTGALVTLPINNINLERYEVYQYPEDGVQTKFGKRAKTFILQNLPDILAPIIEWDQEVRGELPGDARWYAPVFVSGGFSDKIGSKRSRCESLRDGMQRLCELAKVEYKTLHALRHGHAVYGLTSATCPADMEAVSKNLMHGGLKITLDTYAALGWDEVKSRIAKL